MQLRHRKINFIGAGNMTRAIVTGLVQGGYPATLISLCAPSKTNRDLLAAQFVGIKSSDDNVSSTQLADVVVFAVKPQNMTEICPPLREQVDFSNKLVLSIVTGVSVSRFNALLGNQLNLIRVMPNTPAMIGKGMSGLFAPRWVNQQDRDFSSKLMSSVGKICWVDHEDGINSIIAVAGSAPAYFFLFMEAIEREALRLGFDSTTARLLVQQTASGAAALVEAHPLTSLLDLRKQVTSEGGTTAEAIGVFNKKNLADIVSAAMRATIARAQEMEKQF